MFCRYVRVALPPIGTYRYVCISTWCRYVDISAMVLMAEISTKVTEGLLFCVHPVVDSYVAKGSTANLCAIDISKEFDRVNHFALLSKLMKRLIPVQLLHLLESWLLNCYSCLLYTSPSPRDGLLSRMPSSA